MKLTITIENGRVELTIDDGQPTIIAPREVEAPKPAPKLSPVLAPPLEIPQHLQKKPTPVAVIPNSTNRQAELPDCGYCRRRGEACSRHGGERSGVYTAKKFRRALEGNTTAVVFEDPWNCEMCRNAQDLCQLHQTMTDEGKAPARYKLTA